MILLRTKTSASFITDGNIKILLFVKTKTVEKAYTYTEGSGLRQVEKGSIKKPIRFVIVVVCRNMDRVLFKNESSWRRKY